MQRSGLGIIAALLALAASAAGAQRVERGALLTATAEVTSYAFERSVVLIVHHADNGSLGVIVNRPTELHPAETFDGLEALGDYEGRVFIGGPVEPTRPLMLLNDTGEYLGNADRVLDTVHISGDPALVRRNADRLGDASKLRVFAGHVQWEPGQLEAEVAEGAWRVHSGNAAFVFAAEPLALYESLAPGATGRDRDQIQAATRPGTAAATAAAPAALSRAP